jgi:ABC-type phosphate transport system substrate-binding protein
MQRLIGLTALLLFVFAFEGRAEDASIRVVVNPANMTAEISREELVNIFLKRTTQWQSGSVIVPVDLSAKAPERGAFCRSVLRKSVSSVISYWQQQIFSGRDVPPIEKDSDAEVLTFVRTHPNAIGYVSLSADLDGVKALRIR